MTTERSIKPSIKHRLPALILAGNCIQNPSKETSQQSSLGLLRDLTKAPIARLRVTDKLLNGINDCRDQFGAILKISVHEARNLKRRRLQVPVVQTVDSAIHRINQYPADKY